VEKHKQENGATQIGAGARERGGGQLGVEAATGTRTTKKQDANASVGLDKGTQTGE